MSLSPDPKTFPVAAVVAVVVGLMAGSAAANPGASVAITEAWLRPAPAGMSMTSGYMTIHNASARPVRLRAAASPSVRSVTLHRSVVTGGIARMEALSDGLVIPPGGSTVFRPGGNHMMLEGLSRPLKVGDKVTLLPQGVETTVKAINNGAGGTSEADVGLSIDIDLEAETDAGRGDMIATAPLPTVTKEITATICWFGEKPLVNGQRLRLKHTSKVTPVRIAAINGVVDIETLKIEDSDSLTTNQIGLATLQTADPLVVDDYREGRVTGSFVLIDEVTNATVAAGMVGRASFF